MHISFIGFGNMARALATGLIQQGYQDIKAASPSLRADSSTQGIDTYTDNLAVTAKADLLILAVKPAVMRSVLQEIAEVLPAKCLVISIASGLPLAFFEQHLGPVAVVRSMPNTPAAVGLGATPLIANAQVTQRQRQWAEAVFNSVGISTWVEQETLMDAFTAFSGSGPAYVFAFLESFIKAAVDLGIAEPVAKMFAEQTMAGALQLVRASNDSIENLRQKVTSKGGTTEAALNVLSPALSLLLDNAMQAAALRAAQLGKS